jgi:hypothetical protein
MTIHSIDCVLEQIARGGRKKKKGASRLQEKINEDPDDPSM